MNKALFNLPVILAAVMSLAATVVISTWVFADKPEPPTKLLENRPLPAFEVTAHNGEVITRDSLLGQVWVCDFFLTRCKLICPTLSKTMADLADAIGKDKALADVRLISFTVDPEHDTLEVLNQYREDSYNRSAWSGDDDKRWERIASRWGHARSDDKAAFWQIVEEGFGLPVGDQPNNPQMPVGHGSKLVLVDKRGTIRGYYDGLTNMDMPALLADIQRLVDEPDE